MKLLALFLSLLTLVTLSAGLFDENDNIIAVENNDKNINFELPTPLPLELLPVELKWQALHNEKEAGSEEEENTQAILKNALMVGGKSYELFGIFNVEQSTFVLLKNEANEMIKLTLGEKLPGEFTLIEINNNTIIFDNNSEQVEYKLFEKDNNAKN
jgi:hypothetical protein